MTIKYDPKALTKYATALLQAVGYDNEKAQITADCLINADMSGHTTHGLNLLPPYLNEAAEGKTKTTGNPEIIVDAAALSVWDGHYLPGLWLTFKAVDNAIARARNHGIGILSIRRCSHIGCLAVFLEAATSQGMMIILTCSDPSVESVAPYGGTKAIYTPNPIAFGIPAKDQPILIDISASITTNGMSARLAQKNETFSENCLLTSDGTPTSDPKAMTPTAFGKTGEPSGTILPIGGVFHGHKGFGLGLAIEALTQGLSGLGRADKIDQWGSGVFIQVINTESFAGKTTFEEITNYLAEECRKSPAAPWSKGVRIPGDRARTIRKEALNHGLELSPGIIKNLSPWATKYSIKEPSQLS